MRKIPCEGANTIHYELANVHSLILLQIDNFLILRDIEDATVLQNPRWQLSAFDRNNASRIMRQRFPR